jgi:hypothetical protein
VQRCGSGSGRIRVILPDPDRNRHLDHAVQDPADTDQYQFQAHVFLTFSRIQHEVQNTYKHDTFATYERKETHCKFAFLRMKVNFFSPYFLCQSGSGNSDPIGIKTIPIHSTGEVKQYGLVFRNPTYNTEDHLFL